MSVSITNSYVSYAITAYLGLGTNLGDREDNITGALELLSEIVKIEMVSSFYDTAPVGFIEQPRFLNAVCRITSKLAPIDLLNSVKSIETKLGRQLPSHPNAPRIIDIDILLYGDHIMQTPHLTIPHPRLFERAFVLVPFAEIAGNVIVPNNGRSISQLAAGVAGKEEVILWK